MSYCRFSECDVYAYDSFDGGVQFYVSGGRRDLDRLCATYNEAYQYAKALRDEHGLDVPSHAIEALKADALEEAALICGPDSAVADLERENAKLRERLKARELKVVLQESDLDEIVRIACDMYFVISTLEVANDEAVVSKDGVMLDMEHFSKELRELGIEVES